MSSSKPKKKRSRTLAASREKILNDKTPNKCRISSEACAEAGEDFEE